MLAAADPDPVERKHEYAHHYDFDTPAPSGRANVPEYLKHLPVGASSWMEHRHIRALRMHARKHGWVITYRTAKDVDSYVAAEMADKCGRVWRLK